MQPAMIEAHGETMGTSYAVKIFDPPQTLAEDWRFQIDRELRSITDQMSTYVDSSEISRFNASESLEWFPVSSSFATVVVRSLELSEQSGGAFDITVMPLVKAWSFGPSKKRAVPPTDEEIAELRKVVGYKLIDARREPPAIRKLAPQVTIDLNAIAPGHAVDRIVERLAAMGAKNLFVELGGEVRVTGSKGEKSWTVGIQQPDKMGAVVAVAYPLKDRSIATSGDYRSFFEYDGKRYSHTIDPRTGRPITHQLASVTVLADDCMTADGMATVLSVLGEAEGREFATKLGLDSLFMVRSVDKAISMTATGSFTAYVSAPNTAFTSPGLASESKMDANSYLPIAIACMIAFGLIVCAMAIGVIFGRRAISGSCGGLANSKDADGNTSCSLCSNPADACKELRNRMSPAPKASASSDLQE